MPTTIKAREKLFKEIASEAKKENKIPVLVTQPKRREWLAWMRMGTFMHTQDFSANVGVDEGPLIAIPAKELPKLLEIKDEVVNG